jgi:hypothetical protein
VSTLHKEKTLESAIVAALTTDRVAEARAQYMGESRPRPGGYIERSRNDYDRAICLDGDLVVRFLEATQPKEWAKLKQVHGERRTEKFLSRLSDEIAQRGTLDAPASGLNPEHAALYDSNILSVMRQVPFSEKSEQTLDALLFLNGIPVATAELKHHLSGQTVRHAIRQYQLTRDEREPLLKRCLAHFAVDDDLVYVTTRLTGKATRFLPFNKGRDDGAGNPPNPDGFRTAYLWEDVWSRDTWMDLLGHVLPALGRCAAARGGLPVPDSAQRGQRQEQHHRLAGTPSRAAPRCRRLARLRFGHHRDRPART